MELQIGKRKAFFCNVKVILLYLVIYGHLIESRIEESAVLLWQYRLIYAIHMPLYAYVTGMFLKTPKACMSQAKTAIKYYGICQGICVVVSFAFSEKPLSFFKPWWHLWYMLSVIWWALICSVEGKIKNAWGQAVLLAGSVTVACLCGYADCIGRTLSLSRTLCFLPYVLLGRMMATDIKSKEYRWMCMGLGAISFLVFVILVQVVPVEFLYQATSYKATGVSFGGFLRFLCFGVAIGLGAFLLTWIPAKRYCWSKAGSDTMGVYLLHGPFVRLLRKAETGTEFFTIAAPLAALCVYFVLYEVCRWNGKWCRIT